MCTNQDPSIKHTLPGFNSFSSNASSAETIAGIAGEEEEEEEYSRGPELEEKPPLCPFKERKREWGRLDRVNFPKARIVAGRVVEKAEEAIEVVGATKEEALGVLRVEMRKRRRDIGKRITSFHLPLQAFKRSL